MSQPQVVRFDDISNEVKIRVSRGDSEFFFVFKPLEESVLRRYRSVFSGPPGSRQKKYQEKEAFAYLFRTVFVRTEGVDISRYTQGDAPEFSSEVEFWLGHPQAALFADSAIDGYFGNQRPESDDIKG